MDQFRQYQDTEYGAWMMVVQEMKRAGVGDHERLHDVIALWGEELAQLRLHDSEPKHATNALSHRREKWARDWEGRE